MEKIFRISLSNKTFYGVSSVQKICRNIDKKLNDALLGSCDISTFSETFPFNQDDYYIIKPTFITKGLLNLSLKDHKFHRFMNYLKINDLSNYYMGNFDFEANSRVRFGVYYKKNDIETFSFDKNAGVYMVVRSKQKFSDYLTKEICILLETIIGTTEQNIEVCKPNKHWEELLKPTQSPVLSISNLDITDCSVKQIKEMISGATYNVSYDYTGKRLVIQAGAFFPRRNEGLNQALCVNVI